jgi:hypothetical protein
VFMRTKPLQRDTGRIFIEIELPELEFRSQSVRYGSNVSSGPACLSTSCRFMGQMPAGCGR